jgi:hypothetical protein
MCATARGGRRNARSTAFEEGAVQAVGSKIGIGIGIEIDIDIVFS